MNGKHLKILYYLVAINLISINLLAECLIVQNVKENSWFNVNDFSWVKILESVAIISCDEDPINSVIKDLMLNDITTTLNSYTGYHDFLVITNSGKENLTQECISSSIPRRALNHGSRVVIIDLSSRFPTSLKDVNCSEWFLGLASILYLVEGECWVASPPYLACRAFSRAESCHWAEWLHPYNTTPDMQGDTVEVVTFHRPPSTIIWTNETHPHKRYDGMEMKLFLEMARSLNLSWQVNELEQKTGNRFGHLSNGYWHGGVMEALTSGTADLGFGTLWISTERVHYLDYLTSWYRVSTVFLVPKPTLLTGSWNVVLKPFSGVVWGVVALSVCLFPVIILSVLRMHQHITRETPSTETMLSRYCLYTLGTMTASCGILGRHKEVPLRHLISWWYVFTMLLFNYYTSNIVAHITSPTFSSKINTVQELVHLGFSWGIPYMEDDHSYYLDFENYWHRQFAKHFTLFNTSNLKILVQSKNFALVAQEIESSHYLMVDTPIENDLLSQLRVMKERTRTYRSAFAVRKDFRLLPILDRLMQRMIECGITQYYKVASVRRFQNPAFQQMLQENVEHHLTPLRLKHFKFIFYILSICHSFAFLCFMLEVLFYKCG